MTLLNLSHPLTAPQLEQIEALSGKKIQEIKNVPVHFDAATPYPEQIVALVDGLGLTPQQWQNEPILLNPPSFNFIAVALLAELHGRMGYFPPCIRLRPITGSIPPQFEVAEIINLQEMREKARTRR
ncbi:MAG: CRISPR-associated protein Csx15 [candidate division KSB1 bacterium]|nr:CRISPR-associated protein Csx15 [candidate division KSB1 bacterium]MDZ7365947.1 CRISPR-associated protein Csx15 [candidate division KSB1 bacterium]MDZ7403819.1 CRISPR-associated protein Csx15 [candidate division KSB1 bacterium]